MNILTSLARIATLLTLATVALILFIIDNRDEVINEFLDTRLGSAEEEHAFNNLPAQEVLILQS